MLYTTSKASDILHALKNQLPGTLFVFDVDNVLSIPNDLAIQQQWRVSKQIQEYCLAKDKKFDWQKYSDTILLQAKRGLVEKSMIDVMQYIMNNNLPALALTHCQYDKIDNNQQYTSWAEWRYKFLKEIEIDFKILSKLETPYLNEQIDLFQSYKLDVFKWFKMPGQLYNGVILTGGSDKGSCLEAALKVTKLQPSKIVFVDDHEWNLESVQQMCLRNKIDFYGIHYTKAEELEYPYTPYEAREALQVQILVERDVWLSDVEADKLLLNADITQDYLQLYDQWSLQEIDSFSLKSENLFS